MCFFLTIYYVMYDVSHILFQGAVVFCIITKLLMTQNQVQGRCAEVRTHKMTGYQSPSVDFSVSSYPVLTAFFLNSVKLVSTKISVLVYWVTPVVISMNSKSQTQNSGASKTKCYFKTREVKQLLIKIRFHGTQCSLLLLI